MPCSGEYSHRSALKRSSFDLSAFQPMRTQPAALAGMEKPWPSLARGVHSRLESSAFLAISASGSVHQDSGATAISTLAHLQFCQLTPTTMGLASLFLKRKAWWPAVYASSKRGSCSMSFQKSSGVLLTGDGGGPTSVPTG